MDRNECLQNIFRYEVSIGRMKERDANAWYKQYGNISPYSVLYTDGPHAGETLKTYGRKSEKYLRFGAEVDDVLSEHPTIEQGFTLEVCDTPDILLRCGFKHKAMHYTQRHLRDAVHPKDVKGKHSNWHGLSIPQVKKIPELLEHPVFIADSPSPSSNGKESIVVCVGETDYDGTPLLLAIKHNGTGELEIGKIESNFILSVYGRSEFENYFSKQILKKDNLIYFDKRKSQDLKRLCGVQFPAHYSNLDYDCILHFPKCLVKHYKEYFPNTVKSAEKHYQIMGISEYLQQKDVNTDISINLPKHPAFFHSNVIVKCLEDNRFYVPYHRKLYPYVGDFENVTFFGDGIDIGAISWEKMRKKEEQSKEWER